MIALVLAHGAEAAAFSIGALASAAPIVLLLVAAVTHRLAVHSGNRTARQFCRDDSVLLLSGLGGVLMNLTLVGLWYTNDLAFPWHSGAAYSDLALDMATMILPGPAIQLLTLFLVFKTTTGVRN